MTTAKVYQIDPTKPADGVPASKADLRSNLQAAKDEIEALQSSKADLGHQHGLADIPDAGGLAGLDHIDTAEIVDGAVTQAKIAVYAVGADQLQDGIPIDMQDQQLTRPQLKDFSETSATPMVSAGALTLGLETGNVFEVVLTEEVASLLLSNPPAAGSAGSATLFFRQNTTGRRTVAWPNSIRWAGGTPPLVTQAANAIDIYAFITGRVAKLVEIGGAGPEVHGGVDQAARSRSVGERSRVGQPSTRRMVI